MRLALYIRYFWKSLWSKGEKKLFWAILILTKWTCLIFPVIDPTWPEANTLQSSAIKLRYCVEKNGPTYREIDRQRDPRTKLEIEEIISRTWGENVQFSNWKINLFFSELKHEEEVIHCKVSHTYHERDTLVNAKKYESMHHWVFTTFKKVSQVWFLAAFKKSQVHWKLLLWWLLQQNWDIHLFSEQRNWLHERERRKDSRESFFYFSFCAWRRKMAGTFKMEQGN